MFTYDSLSWNIDSLIKQQKSTTPKPRSVLKLRCSSVAESYEQVSTLQNAWVKAVVDGFIHAYTWISVINKLKLERSVSAQLQLARSSNRWLVFPGTSCEIGMRYKSRWNGRKRTEIQFPPLRVSFPGSSDRQESRRRSKSTGPFVTMGKGASFPCTMTGDPSIFVPDNFSHKIIKVETAPQ